jgi:hypothetical protein
MHRSVETPRTPPLLHPVGMHPYGMQNAHEYPRFSTERSIPTEWQICKTFSEGK